MAGTVDTTYSVYKNNHIFVIRGHMQLPADCHLNLHHTQLMYTINKSLFSKQCLYTFCNFTYRNRFTTNENVHIQNHIHVLYKITGQTIHLYNLVQNITNEASIIMKSICTIFCLYVDVIMTTWTIM
jgi:hypothetical protein